MYFDNTLEKVNLETGDVAERIDVGLKPIVVKYSEVSKHLYVGNFGLVNTNFQSLNHGLIESYISVVDPDLGKEIKRIGTTGPPYAVSVLSHDQRYLYVPTAFSFVDVIDTTIDEVVRRLPILVPPGPAHLEISPDGTEMYVLAATGTVTAYSTATGLPVRFPLQVIGLFPGWGALSADGDSLYTVNYYGGVSIIDVATWSVKRNVLRALTTAPLSATLTPDGSELWVCNIGDNTIEVLDAQSGENITTIHTPNPVSYVGFSEDGNTAYASDLGPAANLPINTLGLGVLTRVAIPPRSTGSIEPYDVATHQRIGTSFPVGDVPVAGIY